MEILEKIDKKTLIITNQSNKEHLLLLMNNSSQLYPVKIMDINEYKRNYLFDYDDKALFYLVKEKKMKVSNAQELLENLYYIENKDYDDEKLNYLKKIKQELDERNLLIYNPLFSLYLKSCQVIVYNYYQLDKFSLSLLKDCIFINDKVLDKKINVYEFDDALNEVEYIFNEIVKLLNKKIDINQIKIMAKEEYIPYLERFSLFYNLPISFKQSIYGTEIVNKFLSLIKDTPKENIIDALSIYINNPIYPLIINLINKYAKYDDLSKVYDLIDYDLKKMSLNKKYTNSISLINLDDYVSERDYVFLLGFNNGNYPLLYQDENYLDDDIKQELNMSLTDELNEISRNNTLTLIKRINNLVITYKLETFFDIYFPSFILDNLDINLYKNIHLEYNYNDFYNKLKYANFVDNYLKYGEYNQDLELLSYNYPNLLYQTYDNSYKNISRKKLLSFLNNELTLSYSNIDNYYKCAFRYYLKNILNIEIFEDTFDTIIGNVFHYVLSKAFLDNFDLDKEYLYATLKYELSFREKFFLNKLKKELQIIINTINEYRLNTGLTNELYEKNLKINIQDNPKVIFKGIIDKIMYIKKNNDLYIAVIDYKTGNASINLDYIKYGLSMQLISYLYLIKENTISNLKYCGFYLQNILNDNLKGTDKKSLLEIKRDNLKLKGYSTDDLYRLSMFDASFQKSIMISGIKVKKDGNLWSTCKVLSDFQIDNLINMCKDKIKEGAKNILDGNFPINPKVINNENIGCAYCNFKDICYREPKDDVYLEGGDIDA